MLTDLDIYNDCDKSKPFVFKGTNRNDYGVYAIVIDDEIVNIELYKKSFIDLYNNYKFVETGFSDGKYTIDVLTDDNFVIEQVELPEKLGAIFLSNPTTVLITAETGFAMVGTKCIDGVPIRNSRK